MIEKESKQNPATKRQMRTGGLFSNKEKRVIPGPRYATSGNVTMSTNGSVYRFPNPYGAKQVMFYGNAVRGVTAGHTLTTNTIGTLPAIGDTYEKDLGGGIKLTIVLTGIGGATTLYALSTNPNYATPETGTYVRTSGGGDATIVVTVVNVFAVDIRVDLFGTAQLRPGYYFEPQDTTSVAVSKVPQKIIQSGKYFLIVDENASGATPEYRARVGELHIINIDWPSAIVARATVVDYGPDWFDVEVTLSANWSIQGNFVCT